jgi:tetratricopeptide (TPR) repeat protein
LSSDARDPERNALAREVRDLLRQGAPEEADARVSRELAQSPDSAVGWYLRGVIANRRREHAAAITALRRAIGIDADLAQAWLALGTALARSGALPEAEAAYRRVVAREPGWADAHFNLGLVLGRQGNRADSARALHAAWWRDPMLFDAARACVATIAEAVRRGEAGPPPPVIDCADARPSFTIVVCSIDDAKCERSTALYRQLFEHFPHEIVAIRNARSLAEAYNTAAAASRADCVLMSHDDVDVLAPDFAPRLVRLLAEFDAVGVAGSTRMDGPAVGWSGHPHLRGWITHRAPGEAAWRVDVLDPRPVAGGLAILDGVLLAARREVLTAVPFDARTFDGFHLYDLDWSFRVRQAGLRLGVAGDLLLVHASRGHYGVAWQRYASRFCARHGVGQRPAAASSFFGATLDGADQVRAFFGVLSRLSQTAA